VKMPPPVTEDECHTGKSVKMPPRPWTEDELKRARDMRAAGHFYAEIDKVLRRRTGSTERLLERNGLGYNVKSSHIPDNLLTERDALTAARNRRALTENFCGDPPPGYSALDGKTGQR
jgi:hypothetical protein